MFIDEAELTIKAGNGGNGRVSFFANRSGPSGGDGGKGGSVYAVANSNIAHLKRYTEKEVFKAEDGLPGGQHEQHGKDAADLYLPVPVGTTIRDLTLGNEVELSENTDTVLLARGGRGGRGNAAFKSATHQTPTNAEKGKKGEQKHFQFILKLIAQFGFIGFPNAGKSSLLNLLTAANVKTANYPFTTLEPNLGVYKGKTLADIPGLIEGASTGKGLGIKFLKHIEKVSLLLHCISAESADVVKEYQTVRRELGNFNTKLLEKNELILLTKTDLVDPSVVKKQTEELSHFHAPVIPLSIYDTRSIEVLKKYLDES